MDQELLEQPLDVGIGDRAAAKGEAALDHRTGARAHDVPGAIDRYLRRSHPLHQNIERADEVDGGVGERPVEIEDERRQIRVLISRLT